MTSPIEARDDMFRMFWDSWSIDALVVALAVETRWQGKEEADIPSGYFVRVSKQNVDERLAAFADRNKRYEQSGLIFVQVFAPRREEDGHRNGELLAIAARDIFRGSETSSGVWFRNARYEEVKGDDKHYAFNVIVEFEFDEAA